jgi:DNA mismatch repair protein MutS
MSFCSVLFPDGRGTDSIDSAAEPEFFGDLNLDQIIDSVTHGRDEYNLKPFFYIPLRDSRHIAYRHDVMRDLERVEVFDVVHTFGEQMRAMRAQLSTAEKLHYHWQKARWFLDGVRTFCNAVATFAGELEHSVPRSPGMTALLDYMKEYCGSERFKHLEAEETEIRGKLDNIRYSVLIRGSGVTVHKYAGETDYSEEVQRTFEKFRQGAVKSHLVEMKEYPDMNHVEAHILDFVAQLHPEVFNQLDSYCNVNARFVDPVIARFDREIQFYLAYLEHISRLRGDGLAFCYPVVNGQTKAIRSTDGFDMALAGKLYKERGRIVCNDFYLDGEERIIVVTGPNQGGKTTFARTFGQLHYLASVGCLVPGSCARLFVFDQIFTHFERQEDMKNLRGKLHDDLFRIRKILAGATTNSIILMNEIFSSTSLKDALFLSQKVMDRIMGLDALCVYVTFIEELSSLSSQTISMLSEVEHDAVATRTFKVKRRPADGRSYAVSLAEQYGLTYEQLKNRIPS